MKTTITLVAAAVLALGTAVASADELAELKARNAQLESTVEELTLQLADSLRERKRLEGLLNQAKVASVTAPGAVTTPRGTVSSDELVTESLGDPASSAAIADATAEVVDGCDINGLLRRYGSC